MLRCLLKFDALQRAVYSLALTSSLVPPAHFFLSQVDARQYPVTVHFSKRTEVAHYLNETFKKICQIHRRLPDGGKSQAQ